MRIISFFSFKGGVGRTALVANLGALWAREGKVVVLVDMDLFAPGLTYSPLAGAPVNPESWQGGISDLLDAFLQHGLDKETIAFVPPSHLLREMKLPEPLGGGQPGGLFLIDAGTRVQQLLARPFSSRETTGAGAIRSIASEKAQAGETREQSAFRALARHIKEDLEGFRFPETSPIASRGIDYVLIDSRTGLAELQDLSLGYLAKQMVVVSGLNEQNLRGLELTLEALKQEGRIPVGTFPSRLTVVFSPVPAGEDPATLDALDRGHEVIAAALRVTRAGIRETAPLTAAIHYSPQIAVSDDLLAVARPRALYAKEIRNVSGLLMGEMDTDKDVLIKESRNRTLRIVPLAKSTPSEGPSEASTELPQLLETAVNAELPPWWWPLGSDAEAESLLAKLTPPNPGVSMDRGVLATMLCHSISLTADEKRKILESFPKLSQWQLDELVVVLETEKQKFQQLMAREPQHHPALLALYFQYQRDWAGLILGSERAGLERFLRAPLEGESVFPAWEETSIYWQLLAQDLLLRLNAPDAARQALERAQIRDRDAEAVVIEFLNRLPKDGERPAYPEPAEKLALEMAPGSPRICFMVARSGWRRQHAEAALGVALEPLLAEPPADGDLCYEVLVFICEEALQLAAQAESLARGAVARAAKKSWAWNGLGNLLKDHLARYDEAEDAYRKAIEIDPKFAYPWNGLGNLLQDHLDRYDEAEDAYRKAIEIDPKYATPWNGLGLLKRGQVHAYPEARSCFFRGLEIAPENSYLNMNLGHLLTICGKRGEGLAYLEKALNTFTHGHGWQELENAVWLAVELRATQHLDGLRKSFEGAPPELAQDPAFQMAGVHLGLGLGNEAAAQAAWLRVLEVLSSHGDRHPLLWRLYFTAVARPDLWPTLASFARDLLDLPEERLASFRDVAPPAELLERFRPFAEGLVTEPYDPRDPLYQPLDGGDDKTATAKAMPPPAASG